MQLFVVLLFIDTRSRLKTYIHVVIAHAIRAMTHTVSIITTTVIYITATQGGCRYHAAVSEICAVS